MNFLILISLALPDNFVDTNNGRFRRGTKALVHSKSQNTEHGETGYSNHGKYLVFVNLKLHGKCIFPKMRALAAVVASYYFVHLNKEKKKAIIFN